MSNRNVHIFGFVHRKTLLSWVLKMHGKYQI
jgi:hypothetical protein